MREQYERAMRGEARRTDFDFRRKQLRRRLAVVALSQQVNAGDERPRWLVEVL